MADVTVTLGVDAAAADLTILGIMEETDKATAQLAILRRKALTTISMINSLVTQSYSVIKQLVERAGSIIDPFFDMVFGMISTLVTTAFSGALMLTATLNPALIALGLSLMVISAELSIKSQLEAAESRGQMEGFIARMKTSVAPPTGQNTFGSSF